jgi:TRAF3-interacting protein 1
VREARAAKSETATKADRRVEEADEEIAEMRRAIDGVKAAIARNDQKIAKLLDMVVAPA